MDRSWGELSLFLIFCNKLSTDIAFGFCSPRFRMREGKKLDRLAADTPSQSLSAGRPSAKITAG
jgi:hypothetical protein